MSHGQEQLESVMIDEVKACDLRNDPVESSKCDDYHGLRGFFIIFHDFWMESQEFLMVFRDLGR